MLKALARMIEPYGPQQFASKIWLVTLLDKHLQPIKRRFPSSDLLFYFHLFKPVVSIHWHRPPPRHYTNNMPGASSSDARAGPASALLPNASKQPKASQGR